MPDVSVIIVTYNTCVETRTCIDNVFSHTKDCSLEVIVVDNASTDGTQEQLSKEGCITYICNDANIGFGRANNVGIKRASGRNILFLNSDTLLQNDAISILCKYLDSHPEAGAVGGNLYKADGAPTHSYRRFFPSIYSELNDLTGELLEKIVHPHDAEFNTTSAPLPVSFITGADLMVRRSVLDAIGGGFNPDFFMYYEDCELCWRIHKAGYSVVNVPEARITHLTGYSLKSMPSITKARMVFNSRKLFYRICYSWLARIPIYCTLFCMIVLKRIRYAGSAHYRAFGTAMMRELFRPVLIMGDPSKSDCKF